MSKNVIKETVAFIVVFVMLFSFSSCFDFGNGTTKETKTFVITTEEHTGKDLFYDELFWEEDSLGAIAYLGNRNTWKSGRDKVYTEYFSGIPKSVLDNLSKYDAGGNDVFLFVPRFDQEDIRAYVGEADEEGNMHVTEMLFSGNEPFYIICNNENGNGNVKINVKLKNAITRTIYPVRSMMDGTVVDADGFQDITPKFLQFDEPLTTIIEESQTQ